MILVVDDHADTAGFLCRLLSQRGYVTRCAADGSEALNVLRSETPRLVILDVEMPGMTGLDVLEAMGKDERLRKIAVLIYSAGSDTTQSDRALGLGAKAYLVKGSTDVSELLALVDLHVAPETATP